MKSSGGCLAQFYQSSLARSVGVLTRYGVVFVFVFFHEHGTI